LVKYMATLKALFGTLGIMIFISIGFILLSIITFTLPILIIIIIAACISYCVFIEMRDNFKK